MSCWYSCEIYKRKKCFISVLKANSTKNACFVFWRVTINFVRILNVIKVVKWRSSIRVISRHVGFLKQKKEFEFEK